MWKQSPGSWVTSCVLLALALAACGGGGGGGDEPTDLSGWWVVERRPGGTKGAIVLPYEPFTIIHAADAGSSFWANGTEFTRTGNQLLAIEPSAVDPDREVITLTVMNANQLEGDIERFEANVSMETTDIRVIRTTAPTGAFAMTGTIGAQPASVSSTTAYAGLHEGGAYSEFGVFHVVPYEREASIQVEAEESPLQARTYTVGVGPGMISASAAFVDADEDATSGTVTLTTVGARLVGTYDLTLPGGAVTGSFDVDVLLPGLP